MVVVDASGISEIGRKRKSNEDALCLADNIGLFAVADGMGGHRAGEVASSLVIDTLCKFFRNHQAQEKDENIEETDASLSEAANQVLEAIARSNRAVFDLSQSSASFRGMGSTVSVVYFTANTAITANVGDSPIYLIHDGQIELLSVPHTVIAEQAAYDPEGVARLGENFKHMLTRAVGVENRVAADIHEVPCFKGDVLVIGTDGLSDKVSPEEILAAAKLRRASEACRQLVDLANDRGGDDNITVIVLKVLDVSSGRLGKLFGGVTRALKASIVAPLKKIF